MSVTMMKKQIHYTAGCLFGTNSYGGTTASIHADMKALLWSIHCSWAHPLIKR